MKLLTRLSLLGFVLLVVFAQGLQAGEIYQSLISQRSLAMGNTGIASANDSYAVSYNPAVLANVKNWWIDLAAWTLEASEGMEVLDAAGNLVTLQFPYVDENGLKSGFRQSFLSKDQPHLRANAGINFAARLSDEGVAIGANLAREITIQGLDNNTQIFQRNERIQQVGLSIPLGKGQWVLGLAGRGIERRDATSDATQVPQFGAYESGTAADIGLLFRFAGRNTLGLVVQNAGGTDIGPTPDAEPQELHLGWSADWELGLLRLVPALDVRGVNTTRDEKNRVHAGVEFGLFPNSTGGNLLSLRAGSNRGYPTQGAELNFFNRSLLIGAVRYSEEIGTATAKAESSLRQLVYVSVGW